MSNHVYKITSPIFGASNRVLRVYPRGMQSLRFDITLSDLPETLMNGVCDATESEVLAWVARHGHRDHRKAMSVPLLAYPGKLRFTTATATVPRAAYPVEGREFEFPEYPGVTWFVYREGVWRVVERKTGVPAGSVFEQTMAEAVGKQWQILENMRTAKNHGGSYESVLKFVSRCIEQKLASTSIPHIQ